MTTANAPEQLPPKPAKPKVNRERAWAEARELIHEHRRSITIGLMLMVISRLAGLVLPASSKYLIDEVIGKQRGNMLLPLALAAAAATIVQAITGYANSQIVSVAAQKAIANMRERVQQHVLRLPVSYFDSTKSGVLISRIMNDADGIRNLVGTGLIQLVGGLLTAIIALGVLLWLNWQMTLGTVAFRGLFPLFRKRGEITAEVTGRLTESVGGIRIVKVYVAEEREQAIFSEGIHRLWRNIADTITGTSAITAFTTVIIGCVGLIIIVFGGRAILNGSMTLGGLVMYVFFIGLVAAPLVQIANIGTQISEAFAGLDRIREIRDMATEDQQDERRLGMDDVNGAVEFQDFSCAADFPKICRSTYLMK